MENTQTFPRIGLEWNKLCEYSYSNNNAGLGRVLCCLSLLLYIDRERQLPTARLTVVGTYTLLDLVHADLFCALDASH